MPVENEWHATPSLFDNADKLAIARLAPDAQEIERSYVEATIALIWPYSSSTQRLSLLLAEKDVRLRKSKGQVKVTIHGACAREAARARIRIGDSIKLGLQDVTWSKTGEEVSTPGKKVDWDLIIRKSIRLEVRQGTDAPVVINHVASTPSPTIRSSIVEIVGPKSNTFISIRKPHLSGSTFSPAQRKYNRNSSGSFTDATLDPFADDDGYIIGRGRKRTKFARYSGNWQLSDGEEIDSTQHDQTIPPSPLEPHTDTAVHSATIPNGTMVIEPELELIPDQGPVTGSEVQLLVSIQQNNQTTDTEPEPPRPGSLISNSNGSMAPPPVPDPVLQRMQPPLTTPIDSQPMTTPTPVLQPLLSPGLAMVSPLIERRGVTNGYFPDTTGLQSELDSISHPRVKLQDDVGLMLRPQHTDIIEPAIQQSELEPDSVRERVPGQDVAATDEDAGIDTENSFVVAGQVNDLTNDVHSATTDVDRTFISYPEIPDLLPPGSSEVDLDALQQQIEESTNQWHNPIPSLLEDEDMYGPPVKNHNTDAITNVTQAVDFQPNMYQEPSLPLSASYPALTECSNLESHLSDVEVRPPETAAVINLTAGKNDNDPDMSHDHGRSVVVPSRGPPDLEAQLEEALVVEDTGIMEGDDVTKLEHSEVSTSPDQLRRFSISTADKEWRHGYEDDEDPEVVAFVERALRSRSSSLSTADREWRHGYQNDEDREHAIFLASFLEQGSSSPSSQDSAQHSTSTGSGASSVPKSLSQYDGSDEPHENEEQRRRSRVETEFVEDIRSARIDDAGNASQELSPTRSQKDQGSSSSVHTSMSEEDGDSEMADSSEAESSNAQAIADADTGLVNTQLEHTDDIDATPIVTMEIEETGVLEEQPHSIRQTEISQLITPDATQQKDTQYEDGLPIEAESFVQLPPSPRLTQDNFAHIVSTLIPPDQDRTAGDDPDLPKMVYEATQSTPAISRRLSRKSFTHGPISTEYFAPRRSTRKAQSSPTFVPEPIVEVRQATSPFKPRRVLRSSSPSLVRQDEEARTPPSKPVRGITTPLSYFPFLSTVREYFNLQVDILAVATADSFSPQKSKSGPKDYYTILCVADPSLADNTTIRAEIFRPRRAALPSASRGDVVLLRNMKVQTNEHKVMLLSASSSAWAVFKQSSGKFLDVDVKGPPVEHDEHELAEAERLLDWWSTDGQHKYPDLSDSGDAMEVARQTRSESPRMTRSQRRKMNMTDHLGHSEELHPDGGSDGHKHASSVAGSMAAKDSQAPTSPVASSQTKQNSMTPVPSSPPVPRKQRAHRRTRSDRSQSSVHELRDGTQYVDEEGWRKRSVSVIHELRDGYTYIDE